VEINATRLATGEPRDTTHGANRPHIKATPAGLGVKRALLSAGNPLVLSKPVHDVTAPKP